MAAGAIEALAKVLEPLGLGCIETQETKTRRRRLTMLQCGRRYQRQKKTFGFSSGTEEVTVRVDEDATSLLWWASGADKKHIDLKDVATRGDLVEGLSELLRDTRKNVGGGENPETAPTKGKTVMERTKKQAYFMERDIELTQKRRAAEKRKEKFMKDSGGAEIYRAGNGSARLAPSSNSDACAQQRPAMPHRCAAHAVGAPISQLQRSTSTHMRAHAQTEAKKVLKRRRREVSHAP
eukprot:CAMPEP_0119481722 /NCGR_PEP_ID=MMETSP1344-20130328/9922_1 /TAXON_ID=236787 /ORGANISM="Florenciella parvula, Strain CCMP2471" /LENGTH=236 /DNA_ID=CAMNT_0007516099 /DNA_START=189 /DNA_END=895 /DNA_ORIENTATION=+